VSAPLPRSHSIALRLVGAAALWIAAALIVGGLLLSNLFSEPLERAFEQRLTFLLQSLISVSELKPDGAVEQQRPLGEPRFLRQFSGWYWQIGRIEDKRILNRSRSMWDFEIPIATKTETESAGPKRYHMDGPLGQQLGMIEQRVTEEGVPGHFVFTVAIDRAELTGTIDAFNQTLIWSLGALGAGLLIAIFAQVYYGLRPLKRIRTALAGIRDGSSERLEGAFPAEVAPLADELNGLLDHTGEVLGRARAHVGNLAHALKTPLAVLTNESASPTPDIAATVGAQTELMRRQVDHHLARARAIGQATLLRSHTDLRPVLEALARTLEKIHAERGIRIGISGGEGLAFRGEQHDLEEMLGNLADNACKWAGGEVRLTAEAESTIGSGGLFLLLSVDDDGPGVSEDMREQLFERGRRADETTPGSGLGLSIVRDIAVLYGGGVELHDSPLGGLRATLTIPGSATSDGGAG